MPEPSNSALARDGARTDLAASFDRYARLVQQLLEVPVSLVTVVEHDRQVFYGQLGLPEPWAGRGETPLTHSFCRHVVADQAPLVICDAREDHRLRTNLAVDELDVIAYAGHPITDHTGSVVGSLCAIDRVPRRWTSEQLARLADLAAACSVELSHRASSLLARDAWVLADERERQARVLLSLSHRLSETRTLADVSLAVERVAREQWGCPHAALWLRKPKEDASTDPAGAATRYLLLTPAEVVGWGQAHKHARIAATVDNPVGAAYLIGEAQYFDTKSNRWSSRAEGDRVCMPLRHGGQVLGVLVLAWENPRTFDRGVQDTLAAMSIYTAQAVTQARLYDERALVAATLQEAMLTPLPEVNGLALAARYRPAAARESVGGDWYDAVTLPSGDTALVIGDVIGHDIDAAATMGALRTTLRTLGWTRKRGRPSGIIERFETIVAGLIPGAMCTLLYAHALRTRRPDGSIEVRWTSAGHPLPLLLHPDGTTTWPGGRHDILIGTDLGLPRHNATLTLAPGATLLFFTDGLVERRGETFDEGKERLAKAVTLHANVNPDAMLDAVLADVLPTAPEDDAAVLAVRCQPAS